jgi:hypothetical protein
VGSEITRSPPAPGTAGRAFPPAASPEPKFREVKRAPPDPSAGPRAGRPESPASPASKSASSTLSPLSTTTPIGNASPLGTTTELAPAAAAPAPKTGPEPPKPKPAPGEVAAAAAQLLSGGVVGSDSEKLALKETLEESAALARASASARARVAALRARGASLPELDGRLAAAELLARRGEPAAALKVLEEVLVLANALVLHFGQDGPIEIPDPLDTRIEARLEKVFERAGEAARARTDELLASARLAEKVDEIARARLEELLVSKRLSAKIEEIAQRHAEDVANGAVEALLSSESFQKAVDARARARAEEAFASVKAGASPEALEAAAEKALARREKETSGKFDKLLDPEALEQKLVPLVSSLVKKVIADEQAVANKIRSLVADEVAKVAPGGGADRDEIQLRKLVDSEISRYESVAQPNEKVLAHQAEVIARSDVMHAVLDEQFNVLRAALKKDVIEELERIAAANKRRVQDSKTSGQFKIPPNK